MLVPYHHNHGLSRRLTDLIYRRSNLKNLHKEWIIVRCMCESTPQSLVRLHAPYMLLLKEGIRR